MSRPRADHEATILVVDDEEGVRDIFEHLLRREGHAPCLCESAEVALARLEDLDPDLIISDLNLGGMDGLRFMEAVRAERPEVPFLIITAYGSIRNAVEAIQAGAADYIPKPFSHTYILHRVREALRQRAVDSELRGLRQELAELRGSQRIIGRSESMRRLFGTVRKVARSEVNVLVVGESGTGKGLIAREIHDLSARSARPFVTVDVSALSESVLESELFGHVRGAFTGAHKSRVGLIEEAHGGTLFFDEIGEIPLGLQVKLLRVLQEREFRRVGDNRAIKVDVRVIAATNQDLRAMIGAGTFREDLYYRLNVIELTPPPLRERTDDIPLLAQHFLDRGGLQPGIKLGKAAMGCMLGYTWPGNVRELQNVCERARVLAEGEAIAPEDLPEAVRGASGRIADPEGRFPTLQEVERRHVLAVLDAVEGRRAEAAEILGVDRSTLYRKLKHLGVQDEVT